MKTYVWVLFVSLNSPIARTDYNLSFSSKQECSEQMEKTHLLNTHGELDGRAYKECRKVELPESVLIME